ncbi:phage tail protein [Pectobacterium brasiliense]|uniref:phage tail protein n=1 Tax=Pectobacterium brasiliense TaxID=180957 RepID=UPI001CF39636|nr:phage tail protein [Pectobacterium brasiliense]MCA6982556.1 tail fiber protein [Pectobacterium brasiliense]
MANLSENSQWVDGIYQIETSDPVMAGPNGVSNRQAKELANRTSYLKKEQEKTGSDLAMHTAAADPHMQYAPKENPTFTGTPKAPTPATDSNSQQIATTAFVRSVGATKLAKDQNGADIPDKAAFYNNLQLRGSLGNGMTFARCEQAGDYVTTITDPNTVSDMPEFKGKKLYGYGVLHVSRRDNFVGQEYINHSGDYAWRQKWDDAVFTPWVIALSSSRAPTATDVGALPENATAQAAVKLATPRTINGVPFDGTANITLTPANLGLTETVNLAAGALPKTGGVMSGGVRLGGNLDLPLEKRITGMFPDNTYREMLWLASDNSIQVGDVNSEIALRTKGSLNILVKDKWHQGYHTGFKPTAAEIGAVTKSEADNNYIRQGSLGVIYQSDDLAWNSPTGAYLKDNGGDTSLIWHMGLNAGSASAAQFHFNYSNGGLKYRSSRDNNGFEKPWARIYSDQDKPTAAEIGALSLNEFVGIPMPWPQVTAPSGWLKCNGQAFDKNVYPLLAQAYPSGILPDLRSEFIRGWDDGRGVDTERTLLSAQGDAIRNITGSIAVSTENTGSSTAAGAFNLTGIGGTVATSGFGNRGIPKFDFDASKIVPTANENRPRNISFNYIVRAA